MTPRERGVNMSPRIFTKKVLAQTDDSKSGIIWHTAMESEPNSLVTWSPSEAQERVAVYLRDGWSRAAAAEKAGQGWRTVQRWYDSEPEFVDWIDALRREVLANQAHRFASLLEQWQDIMAEVGRGELDPNHRKAKWAERQLERTLYRVYVARAGGSSA